jgi:MFS family permease
MAHSLMGFSRPLQLTGPHFSTDLSDRLGRKWAVLTGYLLLFIGITVEVVSSGASNPNAIFFVGKIINGFAIGGLIPTGMTYISEVSLGASLL